MREWAREFFASEAWRESAQRRMLAGKAPHLESHIIACELPKPASTSAREVSGGRLTRVIHEFAVDAGD